MLDVAFPKPLKPEFRYPKPRQRLTTVIAIKCKDGIVMGADAQETAGGIKESVVKIRPLQSPEGKKHPFCLMGCAGVSSYIEVFRRYVGEEIFDEEHPDYFQALDAATTKYHDYVVRHCNRASIELDPNLHCPQAIFAGHDPRDDQTHLYLLQAPEPPYPIPEPFRVAVGSGGVYANLLLITAETIMDRANIKWVELSTQLVAQFCYLALARSIGYDADSGMNWSICRVYQEGYRQLSDLDIFPSHGDKEKGLEYRSTIFFKTLLEELTPAKVSALANRYHLIKVLEEYSNKYNLPKI